MVNNYIYLTNLAFNLSYFVNYW